MGSPPKELMDKFKKYAQNIDFNFPYVEEGSGIAPLIQHATPEALDLI